MKIDVIHRNGAEAAVEASEGQSLMEVIRANGVEDIFALCGGSCACGTCHVYVLFMADRLPPMGQTEDDILSCSSVRDSRSRLSCQIPLDSGFTGLRVQIAPED